MKAAALPPLTSGIVAMSSQKKPGENHRAETCGFLTFSGRGERIGTSDPSVPNRSYMIVGLRPTYIQQASDDDLLADGCAARAGNRRTFARLSVTGSLTVQ